MRALELSREKSFLSKAKALSERAQCSRLVILDIDLCKALVALMGMRRGSASFKYSFPEYSTFPFASPFPFSSTIVIVLHLGHLQRRADLSVDCEDLA